MDDELEDKTPSHDSGKPSTSKKGEELLSQDLCENKEECETSESEYTMYCGCNIDQVYEKIKLKNYQENENTPSSQNPNVYTVTNQGVPKNPFGGDIVEAPVYIAATDSIIINRKRLSENDSLHRPIETTFRVNMAVDRNEMYHLDKNDATSLKKQVPEKILDSNQHYICSEPKQNGETDNISNYVPLSPSLKSLPFNENDKEYIVNNFGRSISFEDIIVVTEDDASTKVYQWELDKKEKESTGNEMLKTKSQEIAEVKPNQYRSSVTFKEEPTILSVIIEEEEIQTKAPNKKKSSRSPSILRNNMELRYLSVNFHDYIKMSKNLRGCEFKKHISGLTNYEGKIDTNENKQLLNKDSQKQNMVENADDNLMFQVISLCTDTLDENK